MIPLSWTLIDRKTALVRQWRQRFVETPVSVIAGDYITEARGSAWVSPANSFGWMDGGVDLAIRIAYHQVGCDIQTLVQTAIRNKSFISTRMYSD